MRRLTIVFLALFVYAAPAQADQFRVWVDPHSATTTRSQELKATDSVVMSAFVNGRPLLQGLSDNLYGYVLRGHGVIVMIQAKATTGRARLEIANFQRHRVRVLIRVEARPSGAGAQR